jgi:hypothetical protein
MNRSISGTESCVCRADEGIVPRVLVQFASYILYLLVEVGIRYVDFVRPYANDRAFLYVSTSIAEVWRALLP